MSYSVVPECLKRNLSRVSHAHLSKIERRFNVKFSTYCFHMKAKILADFQICISVPLRLCHCKAVSVIIKQEGVYNLYSGRSWKRIIMP